MAGERELMPFEVDWREVEHEWRAVGDYHPRPSFSLPTAPRHERMPASVFFGCWRFWMHVTMICQHCGERLHVTIIQDVPHLKTKCMRCNKRAEDAGWLEAVRGAAAVRGLEGVRALLGG